VIRHNQFWQNVLLGNVKQMPFSHIWDGGNPGSADILASIRSIGLLSLEQRQARMSGPCAACKWISICGGGFRTRAAFANYGNLWGSDPACYLRPEEIRA